MSKRAHLSFGLVGSIALGFAVVVATGCGGDDEASSSGPSSKGGEGGKDSAAGGSAGTGSMSSGRAGGGAGSSAGASGALGMGSLEEGDQCTTTAECGMGMACVAAKVQNIPIRICGRPCTSPAQCGSENCGSYSGMPKDSICINTEPAPFALCGVGVTAACGGTRQCLYFQDSTVGFCVDLCALDPTKDAGLEEDIAAMCPIASQSCIGGIVDDNGANAVGLCGTEVARDAECGLDEGKLCKGSDICVPEDFNDPKSVQHCREDCSKMGTCTSGGACTVFQDITYCKK